MNRSPLNPLAAILAITATLAAAPAITAQDAPKADPPPPTTTAPQAPPHDTIAPPDDPYSAENYVRPDKPGLAVGDPAPDITLIDFDATEIPLASIYAERPVIIFFFRGGWCRICARTILNWQHIIDDVDDAGATLIAITPQKQEFIDATVTTYEIEFPIFCDHTGRIARAFNVQNIIDEENQERFLKRFKLDLSLVHADGTWNVPAHCAFIIDTEGTIRFADATWSTVKAPDARTVLKALTDLDLTADAQDPNPNPQPTTPKPPLGADQPLPAPKEDSP